MKREVTTVDKRDSLNMKQVAGLAFGVCSGVRKNITDRKQTEKQRLKIATMALK